MSHDDRKERAFADQLARDDVGIQPKPKKCRVNQNHPEGCALDHCVCGTHDTNEENHKCEDNYRPYDHLYYGGE